MQAAIVFGFLPDDLEQLPSAALPTSDSPYTRKKTVSFSSSTSRGAREAGFVEGGAGLAAVPSLFAAALPEVELSDADVVADASESVAPAAARSAGGVAAGCVLLLPQATMPSQGNRAPARRTPGLIRPS